VREVWVAYVAFLTALRKDESSISLLDAASASYSASLDSYKYGVRSVVDVVTAQKQLAQARLSRVSARSELLLDAVALEFVVGNLLRGRAAITTVGTQEGLPR
jgi:outer membrane protein